MLFIMYILYIVLMYFNVRLEQFFYRQMYILSGGRIEDRFRSVAHQNETQALLESEKADKSGSNGDNTKPKEVDTSFNSHDNRSFTKSADHKDCKISKLILVPAVC